MGFKAKQKTSANDGVGQHVASIIDRFAVNCVLDVGANVGQWAVALRGAGYRDRIISFEPVGTTFERLQANARKDRLWDTYRLALGSQEGNLTLGCTRHSGLSSVLKLSCYAQKRYGDGIEILAEETVPVRRLDKLLPDLLSDLATVRLFLKMDTQGLDRHIFEGAKNVLPRVVGLQSELSVIPIYDGMTNEL